MKYFLQDIDRDVIFYADDMTIGTTRPDALQKALNDLAKYFKNNALTVNIVKTKIMKFRSGGRLAKHDHFHYLGKQIDIVNKFYYLEVALSKIYKPNHTWKTCTRKPFSQKLQSTQS